MVLSCLFFYSVAAQSISLKELVDFSDLPQNKIENQLQKKGFKRVNGFEASYTSFQKTEEKQTGNTSHFFQIIPRQNSVEFIYETTAANVHSLFAQQLQSAGFRYTTGKTPGAPVFYQKLDMALTFQTEKKDSAVYYTINAGRVKVPKLKDLQFAEDLLEITSHENLVAVCGKQNVAEDVFSISETVKKKCSIIFPNTSRQAIFVWDDEDNLKTISFVLIGAYSGNKEINHSVLLSSWRSIQGVYCGMSLSEIEVLNKEPVNFYNWRTEWAGLLAPQNGGELNFEKLKPVLNCMNCDFLYIDRNTNIVQSGSAINENQKVYVANLILLPKDAKEISLK